MDIKKLPIVRREIHVGVGFLRVYAEAEKGCLLLQEARAKETALHVHTQSVGA